MFFLLVLAGDRNGIYFYSYDKICTLLQMDLERYIVARDDLIGKDLIASDGTLFQVLDLPPEPVSLAPKVDHGHSKNCAAIAQFVDRTAKRI